MCAIFICILLLTFLLLIAKAAALSDSSPLAHMPRPLSKINSNVNRKWAKLKLGRHLLGRRRMRGAGCRVALSKYQIAGHLVKCCNSNEYLCYESRLIFHLAFWLIEIALTIYMTVCAQVSLCVRKINTKLIAHMLHCNKMLIIFFVTVN